MATAGDSSTVVATGRRFSQVKYESSVEATPQVLPGHGITVDCGTTPVPHVKQEAGYSLESTLRRGSHNEDSIPVTVNYDTVPASVKTEPCDELDVQKGINCAPSTNNRQSDDPATELAGRSHSQSFVSAGASLVENLHTSDSSDENPTAASCPTAFGWSGDLSQRFQTNPSVSEIQLGMCETSSDSCQGVSQYPQSCSGEKPFKCSDCLATFQLLSDLQSHACRHPTAFQCVECGESFNSSSKLSVHMRTHKGEKTFLCKMCETAFKTSSHLYRHMRTKHTEEKPFACGECGKSFGDSGHLKRHMMIHTGQKPFQCGECGKSFTDSTYLKVHMRTHTGEKPFDCEECGRSFIAFSSLKKHMQTHAAEKLKCAECGATFGYRSSLKRHMLSHAGSKFVCNTCGAAFSNARSLKRHLLAHYGDRDRPGECSSSFSLAEDQICSFADEQSREDSRSLSESDPSKQHIPQSAGDETFNGFGGCGASSSKSNNLKTHRKTGDRPFECDECGASFSLSSSLKRHKRIHTGQEPYQCGECKMSFTQSNTLVRHMRIHTGEKPFNCQECGLSFSDSGNLKKHQRSACERRRKATCM